MVRDFSNITISLVKVEVDGKEDEEPVSIGVTMSYDFYFDCPKRIESTKGWREFKK